VTTRRLFDRAPPACDLDSVRRGLDAAIAFGVDAIGVDLETERTLGSHELMCRAGEASIDLALIAQVFKSQVRRAENIPEEALVRSALLLRERAAATTRLVARALEVHARDTGYSRDVWLMAAHDGASLFLLDSLDAGNSRVATMPPLLARIAARSLFDALASSNSDRMAVPGYLADSLGANLALFMHAQAAVSTGNGREFT
jgi:hypothetical protein